MALLVHCGMCCASHTSGTQSASTVRIRQTRAHWHARLRLPTATHGPACCTAPGASSSSRGTRLPFASPKRLFANTVALPVTTLSQCSSGAEQGPCHITGCGGPCSLPERHTVRPSCRPGAGETRQATGAGQLQFAPGGIQPGSSAHRQHTLPPGTRRARSGCVRRDRGPLGYASSCKVSAGGRPPHRVSRQAALCGVGASLWQVLLRRGARGDPRTCQLCLTACLRRTLRHAQLRGRGLREVQSQAQGPSPVCQPWQVRSCGDRRGRGAFAMQRIERGMFLGDYEGELLDEEQFYARYPSGTVSGYSACMCLPGMLPVVRSTLVLARMHVVCAHSGRLLHADRCHVDARRRCARERRQLLQCLLSEPLAHTMERAAAHAPQRTPRGLVRRAYHCGGCPVASMRCITSPAGMGLTEGHCLPGRGGAASRLRRHLLARPRGPGDYLSARARPVYSSVYFCTV